MLKLNPNYTYQWPVTVPFPADGGQIEPATFTAQFQYMGQKALEAARASVISDQDAAAFVGKVMVGWSGVQNDKGAEVPFGAEALGQLLDIPSVALAIMQTYSDSLRGVAAKN